MKISKSLIIIFIIAIFFLTIISACSSNIPHAEIESFIGVKTIQVLVGQSYYDDIGNRIEDFSLPIYEMCEKTLKSAGFRVVNESSDKYDAVLEIKLKGTALPESYYIENSYTILYTGASIDGDISILVENVNPLKTKFHEEIEPPEVIVFRGEPHAMPPQSAPFVRVGWQKHLFLLLNDIWGIEFLLKSLKIEDTFTRSQVIEALTDVKDPLSVNILINALEVKSLSLNKIDIIEALGKKGDKSAVPVLADILINNEYSHNRKAAARALGEIGDKDVLDTLNLALIEDEDDDVRKACSEAIDIILEEEGNN